MTKKRKRKKWDKKELFFIIENTAKYPNSYLKKKFKTTKKAIYEIQFQNNISIKDNIIRHDYFTETQFCEKLGLTKFFSRKLRNQNAIDFKKLDQIVLIPFEEVDRIEKFLSENIKITTACKLLKITKQKLLKVTNIELLGTSEYCNKEKILEIKKILNNSFTVEEFSKKSFYSIRTIYRYIENKKIKSFLDCFGETRIYKSELKNLKIS